MVVICWNRLGQQHAAVWEAGSLVLAFEIDIYVLGGPVVSGWLIVKNGHKMKQINAIEYCFRQSNSI
jgi:hypothetical protein